VTASDRFRKRGVGGQEAGQTHAVKPRRSKNARAAFGMEIAPTARALQHLQHLSLAYGAIFNDLHACIVEFSNYMYPDYG
jgi:hypothetical protein